MAKFVELGNHDEFERWLNKQPEWEPLDINLVGSFKTVFLTHDLVVKFDAVKGSNHCAVEAATWKQANPRNRKYLARIVADTPGMLVQERVPKACPRAKCRSAAQLAEKLVIYDWDANHSHFRDGTPVFFDYDPYGGMQ